MAASLRQEWNVVVAAVSRRVQSGWKTLIIGVPFFWLLLFFLAPFFIVLKISLAESLIASPPFSSLIEITEEGIVHLRLIMDNFLYLVEDDLYLDAYLNSLKISLTSTLLCLLLGYPIAYARLPMPSCGRPRSRGPSCC